MKRPLLIFLPIVFLFALLSVTAWKLAPGEMFGQILVPKETTQQKMQRMLDAARKHMVITDPNPFVGEVKNVQFLRTQFAIYDNAKDGDILILTQDRAMLYSPGLDRITYAVSRRDAYGELTPPGIRRVQEPDPPPAQATLPCPQPRSASPWMLQPVGNPSS